jgi:Flp pilus assembly protein TadB
MSHNLLILDREPASLNVDDQQLASEAAIVLHWWRIDVASSLFGVVVCSVLLVILVATFPSVAVAYARLPSESPSLYWSYVFGISSSLQIVAMSALLLVQSWFQPSQDNLQNIRHLENLVQVYRWHVWSTSGPGGTMMSLFLISAGCMFACLGAFVPFARVIAGVVATLLIAFSLWFAGKYRFGPYGRDWKQESERLEQYLDLVRKQVQV